MKIEISDPHCANSFNSKMMRPGSLDVSSTAYHSAENTIIRETYKVWGAANVHNRHSADKTKELFHQLNIYPSRKQINDILQTVNLLADKSFEESGCGQEKVKGLKFSEFCILVAEFRKICLPRPYERSGLEPCLMKNSSFLWSNPSKTSAMTNALEEGSSKTVGTNLCTMTAETEMPEVFLGGSCNPTTWRADVAIPTLKRQGISFYNPQVSDWTPDLIELEHRAKEKAHVLFFVMDSETRASAGAIEAAHIAGQNSKHLVLVMHPYKRDQSILNEPLSFQEYSDLLRNQEILCDLVARRGLPILHSIPSGLQRIKAILAGTIGWQSPSNIASRLISVQRAFEQSLENFLTDKLSVFQTQSALTILGYTTSLLRIENITRIVLDYRDNVLNSGVGGDDRSGRGGGGGKQKPSTSVGKMVTKMETQTATKTTSDNINLQINFEEFCLIVAHLTIAQQNFFQNTCVSPIKGINLPPPPIFLTNTPEWLHSRHLKTPSQDQSTETSSSSASVSCNNSNITNANTNINANSIASVTAAVTSSGNITERTPYECSRSRDSGISSPLPQDSKCLFSINLDKTTKKPECTDIAGDTTMFDSDSDDSVFSSGSSSDSNVIESSQHEMRDIYLGGSCMLRTKWRQEYVIPMLNKRSITFHLPSWHANLLPEMIMQQSPTDDGALDASVAALASSLPLQPPPPPSMLTPIPPPRQTPSSSSDSVNNCSVESNYYRETSNYIKSNRRTKKRGCSLTNPHGSLNDHCDIGKKKKKFDSTLLDASRVLLFVITNETRCLAPMTMAAHYIGLGYNVVLCVQMLPTYCTIGRDTLTPVAIKDYNRGRAYLIDLAKRQGVPVFNDLQESVECAIHKIRMH